MKKIPLNMQTFSELITQNCVYVDKTAHIYSLITSGKTCFLSRPRRFGKSLLISTLEAIFQGRKELFVDLAISKTDYTWPIHPVIRLDFGIIPHQTPEELRIGLCNELYEIAKMHRITLERTASPGELLKLLVRELSSKNQVVILIDEYDKPILDHIDNFEIAAQCQIVLKSFYETIKGLDQFCRFTFLTGVSKFTKTSVFSGLNNLNDISEKALGALIVGYTKAEIEHYFADHLKELVDHLKKSPEEVLDLIRQWYDGYRFCTDHEVARLYAPLSVMYCLQDRLFKNYWFATGTPSYLVKLLKNKNYDLSVLEKFGPLRASEAIFGIYDVSSIALEALLYQAGYMTVQSYDSETNIVEIDYPNQEVRTSMRYLLLSMKVDLPDVNVRPAVDDIRIGFLLCDMHKVEYGLQTLLANIPSQHHRPDESFYHTLFHMITTVIGFATSSEDSTHTGKPDLIVQTKDRIYVIEFKFNKSTGQGMQQILDRRYYERYRDLGKQIVLVEITFMYQNKRIQVASAAQNLD
ncbi:AAA family ATPase [Candidatus Dependentiae bacterium]|jgi:hypothetical protein|nr:AAA family ATPase [Candidatus Dependentiae bacterium]